MKNQEGFEMEGTRQLLLCANDVRLFGNNATNTESPLVISNGDGPQIYWGESLSVCLSLIMRKQKGIIPLQCGKFKCLGTTEKIKIVFTKKLRTD